MWSMPTERVAPSARCFSMTALDHFENGLEYAADRRRSGLGKNAARRATADEDGHYCFAVAL